MDLAEWHIMGWEALRVLAAAFLCGLIGIERQYHQKNAGMRTHSLVGMGACLFTIVGMHPWALESTPAGGDAMRVAAQVVTGIGFLGAGVIFVNRDAVRGLTTAAGIWLSAALGMACGAGMVPLAAVVTLLYLLVVVGVSTLVTRLPTRDRHRLVRMVYTDRTGALRRVLTAATEMGFECSVISTHQMAGTDPVTVEVVVRFTGDLPLKDLVAELSEIADVRTVETFEDSRFQDE